MCKAYVGTEEEPKVATTTPTLTADPGAVLAISQIAMELQVVGDRLELRYKHMMEVNKRKIAWTRLCAIAFCLAVRVLL